MQTVYLFVTEIDYLPVDHWIQSAACVHIDYQPPKKAAGFLHSLHIDVDILSTTILTAFTGLHIVFSKSGIDMVQRSEQYNLFVRKKLFEPVDVCIDSTLVGIPVHYKRSPDARRHLPAGNLYLLQLFSKPFADRDTGVIVVRPHEHQNGIDLPAVLILQLFRLMEDIIPMPEHERCRAQPVFQKRPISLDMGITNGIGNRVVDISNPYSEPRMTYHPILLHHKLLQLGLRISNHLASADKQYKNKNSFHLSSYLAVCML